MDMNRILALRAGEVVEYDSPANLVQKKSSMLYGMIKATGKANSKHLKKLAMGQETIDDAFRATKDSQLVDLGVSPMPPRYNLKEGENLGSPKLLSHQKKKTKKPKERKRDAPDDDQVDQTEKKENSEKKSTESRVAKKSGAKEVISAPSSDAAKTEKRSKKE